MKNTFKLMALALLAGSMIFVSCKKDEDDNSGNNGNNGNTQTATYTLTYKANDPAMGTVTADPAKTAYEAGETVVLTATANEGYRFANWSDGNSDATRTITISSNGNNSYTANFVAMPTSHANVEFGTEASWSATTFLAGLYQGNFIMQLWKDYDDDAQPMVQLIGGQSVGTFAASQDNEYGWLYYNYYGESAEYNGNTYARWQTASMQQTITSIDMNELYIEFTATGAVYDLAAYAEGEQVTMPLTIDVASNWENANWQKGGLKNMMVK